LPPAAPGRNSGRWPGPQRLGLPGTPRPPRHTPPPAGARDRLRGPILQNTVPSFLLKKADKAILFKFLVVAQGVLPPVMGLGVVPGLVFLGQSRLHKLALLRPG